jgi:hypothetical protein
MRSIVVLGFSLVGLIGCATYRDDLARGQHYYDMNQYDNALSVWRMLERDWDSLDYADQCRYAYLRGMTDYRMGYRADARHWLALSAAIVEKHPGGLDAQATAELNQKLTQLNDAVYGGGPATSPVAAGVELTNETPSATATFSGAAPATTTVNDTTIPPTKVVPAPQKPKSDATSATPTAPKAAAAATTPAAPKAAPFPAEPPPIPEPSH